MCQDPGPISILGSPAAVEPTLFMYITDGALSGEARAMVRTMRRRKGFQRIEILS